MVAGGVPMRVVTDILGHSKMATTADLYAHVLPAHREVADLIDQSLRPKKQETATRLGVVLGVTMPDYGHDLQFGFFLDPTTGNPEPHRRDRPHPRRPRLRPDRHPGSPLSAEALRCDGADRLSPRPDGAHPHLPRRRQSAPAPAGDAGQGGGDARSAERWPLRARSRRGRVLGCHPGHGWSGAGAEGGAGRAAGGDHPHPRLLERPDAAPRRRDLPGDREPDRVRRPRTTSASGSACSARGRYA